MNNPDLFGHTPPQGDLFAGEPVPERKVMDFQSEARARLNRVLAEARAAERLPWSDRDARMWEVLFPQMAQWLPDDEADQLCFEFAREVERLKRAA